VFGAKNIPIAVASLKMMGRLSLHYLASISFLSTVRGGHFSTWLTFYLLGYLKLESFSGNHLLLLIGFKNIAI
jgi:hypothetical protein